MSKLNAGEATVTEREFWLLKQVIDCKDKTFHPKMFYSDYKRLEGSGFCYWYMGSAFLTQRGLDLVNGDIPND